MSHLDIKQLRTQYQVVKSRIRQFSDEARRDPSSISLIAVSKTKPAEAIQALYEYEGHCDYGENYAQELFLKADKLSHLPLRWHFIGRLQSNKLRRLWSCATTLQSLCQCEHAAKMHQLAQKNSGSCPEVFLLVNVGQEKSKAGLAIPEVKSFYEQIKSCYPEINIAGLMAIPPQHFSDEKYPHTVPPEYKELRILASNIGSGLLSLGMSSDLRLAIKAGSDIVRVGSAIFGERL